MCGLGFDDFCLLTPFEFQSVLISYCNSEQQRSRDMWECMRQLAAVSVSPFSKGRVKPEKLLKFPWDDEVKEDKNRKPVSKEEDVEALKALMKRTGL